jgi:hypothetical protein
MNPSLQPPSYSGRPPGWIERVRAGCHGRNWVIPLAAWLYLAYAGVRQFNDPVNFNSLFWGINLAIHEGGHLLMRPLGNELLHVAGGTLLQLAAPIISLFILGGQRDYFGVSFCFGWLSTNLIGVGVYMADARARELPLVSAEGAGSSQAVTHDWAYLFTQFGLMEHDTQIGLVTRGLGTASMAVALIGGAWTIWEMFRSTDKQPDAKAEQRDAIKRRAKLRTDKSDTGKR